MICLRTDQHEHDCHPRRFTKLPDEAALNATVVALEEHGFSVEVVGDLDAARQAVLARIPAGSSVMTNASVTLEQTGIADAINDGAGRWESARNKMFALDFATQAQQMKAIGGQPDYALGSVHAITADGTLVIASASGSQLASYAWGAANVIFVAGAQKLVPTLAAAHQRIYTHSLPRPPRGRAGSGTCTRCCSTGRRHSKTTTCAGTPPSSAWTWRRSSGTGPARRWRTGSAGMWTAAWPRARCSAPPPCSSTGFVHRGGYDPPALLAALAR